LKPQNAGEDSAGRPGGIGISLVSLRKGLAPHVLAEGAEQKKAQTIAEWLLEIGDSIASEWPHTTLKLVHKGTQATFTDVDQKAWDCWEDIDVAFEGDTSKMIAAARNHVGASTINRWYKDKRDGGAKRIIRALGSEEALKRDVKGVTVEAFLKEVVKDIEKIRDDKRFQTGNLTWSARPAPLSPAQDSECCCCSMKYYPAPAAVTTLIRSAARRA